MLSLLRVTSKCVSPLVRSTIISQQIGQTPLVNVVRNTSFFNRTSADQLWKGVTSVSNAGRKRGRARGISKKGVKNLNKGQIIGVGKTNMVWPGLTKPVMQGRELVQQVQLPPDPEREEKLIKLRDAMTGRKRKKQHPLERGWSGGKMGGRSIGPPDPIGEDTFENFDTRVLEFKMVTVMTGNLGRKRSLSTFCVTGNKNGLAGIALAKAMMGEGSLRKAKNRAGQKLMYFPIYNGHTVFHDFYSKFGSSKIFVSKKPEGFGLVCHRAVKTCCEVIGIKDLYAKVEGSTNVQNVVKAFLIGLLQQKTHEQLAEETQLHLVEMREERDNYPVVVASPTECLSQEEAWRRKTHEMDFKQYVLDNRVVYKRKKFPRFYVGTKGWESHLKKTLYRRNHPDVRVRLLAEYGDFKSFLTEKYPECRPNVKKPEEA